MVACCEAVFPESNVENCDKLFWSEGKEISRRRAGLSWADLADDEEAAMKEAESLSEKAESMSEKAGEAKQVKRIWFVKVPKPSNSTADIQMLEKQLEELAVQVKRHNESLDKMKQEKAEAKNNTLSAKKRYKEAQCRVRSKREDVKRAKESARRSSRGKKQIGDRRGSNVPITEAGLRNLIKEMEFRLQHESISLREETQLVGKLAKLNALQTRTRSQNCTTGLEADSQILEKELQILIEEEASSRQLYEHLEELERGVDRELEQAARLRCIKMEAKSEVVGNLKAARKHRHKKMAAYSENRDFSRDIRQMVTEGYVERARAACEQQVEQMLNKMASTTCVKPYHARCKVKNEPVVLNRRSKYPTDASIHTEQELGSISVGAAVEPQHSVHFDAAFIQNPRLSNVCSQSSPEHEVVPIASKQLGNSLLKSSKSCSESESAPTSGAGEESADLSLASPEKVEIAPPSMNIPKDSSVSSCKGRKQTKRKKKSKKNSSEVPDHTTNDRACEKFNINSEVCSRIGERNSTGQISILTPERLVSSSESKRMPLTTNFQDQLVSRNFQVKEVTKTAVRKTSSFKSLTTKTLELVNRAALMGALLFGLLALVYTLLSIQPDRLGVTYSPMQHK